MPAQVLGLIDKLDSSEIVLDQIAAILAVESGSQEDQALLAAKNPALWKLRVFALRMNPWAEFIDSPLNDTAGSAPIVNVSLATTAFPKGKGNVVESQQSTGTFYVDCYGYGLSSDVPGGGHVAGDERARRECARAVRLVRNILMSAQYIHLGLKGVVAGRWLQSVDFNPEGSEVLTVQNVAVARMTFEVDYLEHSPQWQGTILRSLSVEVTRSGTGQVLLRAQFPTEESP